MAAGHGELTFLSKTSTYNVQPGQIIFVGATYSARSLSCRMLAAIDETGSGAIDRITSWDPPSPSLLCTTATIAPSQAT